MAKPNHIPAGLVAQRSLAPRRGRSASCTVICGDAFEFLASYPFTGRELVYCDPPYLRETRRYDDYYRYELSVDDHIRCSAS